MRAFDVFVSPSFGCEYFCGLRSQRVSIAATVSFVCLYEFITGRVELIPLHSPNENVLLAADEHQPRTVCSLLLHTEQQPAHTHIHRTKL